MSSGPAAGLALCKRLDAALVLAVCVLAIGGCLRAPIRDVHEDGSVGLGSSGPGSSGPGASGALDEGDTTGLGSSSSSGETPTLDDSRGETSPEPEPVCHASYDPCLPIVDDLNCPDVVALGAAPVMVIGPDDYGLDADDDGIGCEP